MKNLAQHRTQLVQAFKDPGRLIVAPYHCLSKAMAFDMMSLRFAAPAVLALSSLAGCLTYFGVAPAKVFQPTKESPSTVGQAQATDIPIVVDRLRPSDEDIVKAFRQATEDRQPVETQDAIPHTDEPAIVLDPSRYQNDARTDIINVSGASLLGRLSDRRRLIQGTPQALNRFGTWADKRPVAGC